MIAKLLPTLHRFENTLRPFSVVGRNMLPVFCCQICLSVLLVGTIDPSRDHKPLTFVLVFAQILSIFVIASLFEWRANTKNHPAGLPMASS